MVASASPATGEPVSAAQISTWAASWVPMSPGTKKSVERTSATKASITIASANPIG